MTQFDKSFNRWKKSEMNFKSDQNWQCLLITIVVCFRHYDFLIFLLGKIVGSSLLTIKFQWYILIASNLKLIEDAIEYCAFYLIRDCEFVLKASDFVGKNPTACLNDSLAYIKHMSNKSKIVLHICIKYFIPNAMIPNMHFFQH